MDQIKNVNDVFSILENVDYGWLGIDNNIYHSLDKGYKKKYILQSPSEVLKNKVATHFDLVELERECFKELGLKFNTYFMVYYESKRVFTYTFLVYEEKEKFHWFEYSWENNKGIHEYMSLYDLLVDVRNKFKTNHNLKYMDLDYLCVYKYKKPKAHLGLKDLYKHCESGENVLI